MHHPVIGCRGGHSVLEDLAPPGKAEVQSAFPTALAIFLVSDVAPEGHPSGATDILT